MPGRSLSSPCAVRGLLGDLQAEPRGSQRGEDDAEAEPERPRPLSGRTPYRKRRSWGSESLPFSIDVRPMEMELGVEGNCTDGR